MKLRQWLYGAAALGMLAACSDHDVQPAGPTDEGGDGYIGVKIQLPSVPSTRVNDDFNDGVGSEYAINDAVLAIFQGSDMTSATCTGIFNLKNSNPVEDADHKQITQTVTRVANVSGIQNNKVYGLVMLNAVVNGLLSSDLNDTQIIGKKIQDLQELATDKKLFTQTKKGVGFASNIFMTNSPLSATPGGGNDPKTISGALPVLVELTGTTYPTEKEALDNPAGTIHVERSVGKITCSKFGTATDVVVKIGNDDYKLVVKNISWDMAQDMAKSYLVRNTNRTPAGQPFSSTTKLWRWDYASENIAADATVGSYRMLGHTPLTEKDAYYRPYFCQVPGYGDKKDDNYENKTFEKTIMRAGDAQALTFSDDPSSAFYPRENTFPVDFMKYANTTRIGFWVEFEFVNTTDDTKKLDGNKNFYISGADKSILYFDENGVDPLTKKVLAALQDESKYPKVKAAIMAAVKTDQAGKIKMTDIGKFLDIKYASELDVTDENYAKDGEVRIVDIAFKPFTDDIYHNTEYEGVFAKAPELEDVTSLITDLNNLGDYYRYTGGKVFYELRIKHFGDDLTPWKVADGAAATTIDQSYGTDDKRDANYLGRYGIVRNNWYDVEITKITKLGHPEDPAAWEESWPGKPDDNLDQYIAVELRILSWAKRTQEHEF